MWIVSACNTLLRMIYLTPDDYLTSCSKYLITYSNNLITYNFVATSYILIDMPIKRILMK